MADKKNNGFGRKKYPYQVNVKLTEDDMAGINRINAAYFGGDASASLLVRAVLRKGMAMYKDGK